MFGTETRSIAVGESPPDTSSNTHKQVHVMAAGKNTDIKKRAIYLSLLIYFWCLQAGIVAIVINYKYYQAAALITVIMILGNTPLFALAYIFAGDMRRYRANSKNQYRSLKVAVEKDEMSLQPPPPRPKCPEHWAADYAWLLVTKQLTSCSRDAARKVNVNDAMWYAAKDYFINSGLAFEQTISNKPSFSLRKFSTAADFVNRLPDDPPPVVSKIPEIDKVAQLTTLAIERGKA